MTRAPRASRIATLWQLAWKSNRLCCAVYRSGEQFELRLLIGTRVVLTEPFELGPKTLSRTQALKRSLKRRGWQDDREPRDRR